jgi:hypothetical protein
VDVDVFDEVDVVVMRLVKNQKPTVVEITNPTHKIIVAKVNWMKGESSSEYVEFILIKF